MLHGKTVEQGNNGRFIAVFDSGIGGLTVLQQIRALLPHEHILYFADQANIPYGGHSLEQVSFFSEQIAHFLLEQQVKLVVIACNTASAAALTQLRNAFPNVPFVGMEPAVKPAIEKSKTKVIGVMATEGTFASERYASLVATYATRCSVIENPCRGLVPLIEQGDFQSKPLQQKLAEITKPMLAANIDTLVLGCTHYPLIKANLTQLLGSHVTIIDPAPAVARQTERILEKNGLKNRQNQAGTTRYISSGAPVPLARLLEKLGAITPFVETAVWENGRLNLKNRV
jgi:glutamate racemase